MSLKTLLHLDAKGGIQNYDPILKIYNCYSQNVLINKPVSSIKEILLNSKNSHYFLIILELQMIAIH